jgi:hypothetical protein
MAGEIQGVFSHGRNLYAQFAIMRFPVLLIYITSTFFFSLVCCMC